MPPTSSLKEVYEPKITQMVTCFGHPVLAHEIGGWAEKSEKDCGVGIRSADITAPNN